MKTVDAPDAAFILKMGEGGIPCMASLYFLSPCDPYSRTWGLFYHSVKGWGLKKNQDITDIYYPADGDWFISKKALWRFFDGQGPTTKLVFELLKRAYRDCLTGNLNRAGWNYHCQILLRWAKKYQQTIGMLLLDLDDFRMINAAFGHIGGDLCLKNIGRTLSQVTHQYMALGRYGGEEWAILMVGIDRFYFQKYAELIRYQVLVTPLIYKGYPIACTGSIGGVYSSYAYDTNKLLAQADYALNQAKQAGKNKVVLI